MEVTIEMETKAFRRWTEDLVKDLKRTAAERALKALAFEFLSRVIPRTPVDTGRARGGWASYLIRLGKTVNGVGAGSSLGVDEGSFEEHFTESEQSIVLINAVHYIVLLEYGWSDQAPAGMVRITFREMRVHRSGAKKLQEEFVKAVARTNRLRRQRGRSGSRSDRLP